MASNNNVKQQYTPQKKPPKMLKEFLQETTTTPTHSSFPRRLPDSTLHRSRSSRSRAAAETALNKLLSAFNTILDKWPIKRPMRTKSLNKKTVSKVKVKDILLWRSLRDAVVIAEESSSKPLDNCSLQFEFDTTVSPTVSPHCDIVTTSTTEDICSSCSSELGSGLGLGLNSSTESSVGESSGDFRSMMDELPCWWGNYFDQGEMWDQGDNDVVATVCGVEPKEDNNCTTMEDEKEQHSPVSVLDSPFREELSDHEFESSFDQSFANMERTKKSLLQRIQWLENLAGVTEDDDEIELAQEEEPRITDNNTIATITKESSSKVIICKFIREQCFKDKETCIKEMEMNEKWTSKLEEEKEELGVELEVKLLADLMNKVLVDLLG